MAINAPPVPDYGAKYLDAFKVADTSARDYARIEMEKVRMAEAAVQRARENRANDFKMMLDAVQNRQTLEQRAVENDFKNRQLDLMGENAQTSRINARTNNYRATNPPMGVTAQRNRAIALGMGLDESMLNPVVPESRGSAQSAIPDINLNNGAGGYNEAANSPLPTDATDPSTMVPSSMGPVTNEVNTPGSMQGTPGTAYPPGTQADANGAARDEQGRELDANGNIIYGSDLLGTNPRVADGSPVPALEPQPPVDNLVDPAPGTPPPSAPAGEAPAPPVPEPAPAVPPSTVTSDAPTANTVVSNAPSAAAVPVPTPPVPSTKGAVSGGINTDLTKTQEDVLTPTSIVDNNLGLVTQNNLVKLTEQHKQNTANLKILDANEKGWEQVLKSGVVKPEAVKIVDEKLAKIRSDREATLANEAAVTIRAESYKKHADDLNEISAKLSSMTGVDSALPNLDKAKLLALAADPSNLPKVKKVVTQLEHYEAIRKSNNWNYTSNGIDTAIAVGELSKKYSDEKMADDQWDATHAASLRKELDALDPKAPSTPSKITRIERQLDSAEKGEAKYLEWAAKLEKAVKMDKKVDPNEKVSATPQAAMGTPAAAPERPGIGLIADAKPNQFWSEGKAQVYKLANLDKATDEELKYIVADHAESQSSGSSPDMRNLYSALGTVDLGADKAVTPAQRLAAGIGGQFAMPPGGDSYAARGRRGGVSVEDFIKAAAEDELRKRTGGVGGKPGTRNATQVSEEDRAKASKIPH